MSGVVKAAAIAYALWFVVLIAATFRVGRVGRARVPKAVRYVIAGVAAVGVLVCWAETIAPVTAISAAGRVECIGEPATALAGGAGELISPECHSALIARTVALGVLAAAIVVVSAVALAVLASWRVNAGRRPPPGAACVSPGALGTVADSPGL
jgi:hypothetical protein